MPDASEAQLKKMIDECKAQIERAEKQLIAEPESLTHQLALESLRKHLKRLESQVTR